MAFSLPHWQPTDPLNYTRFNEMIGVINILSAEVDHLKAQLYAVMSGAEGECPECHKLTQIPINDYICYDCRSRSLTE